MVKQRKGIPGRRIKTVHRGVDAAFWENRAGPHYRKLMERQPVKSWKSRLEKADFNLAKDITPSALLNSSHFKSFLGEIPHKGKAHTVKNQWEKESTLPNISFSQERTLASVHYPLACL